MTKKADGSPRAYFNCKTPTKMPPSGCLYIPIPMQDLILDFVNLFRQCRMSDAEITVAVQAAAAAYLEAYRAAVRERKEPEPKCINIFEDAAQ